MCGQINKHQSRGRRRGGGCAGRTYLMKGVRSAAGQDGVGTQSALGCPQIINNANIIKHRNFLITLTSLAFVNSM